MTEFTKNDRLVIGITMGDYNGIGPEIVIKSLSSMPHSDIAVFLIIGSVHVMDTVNFSLGNPISFEPINSISEINTNQSKIYTLNLFERNQINFNYGSITKEAGAVATQCIKKGVALALRNQIHALVTAPVSKEGLAASGVNYPGQTELLADLTHSDSFAMVLLTETFRVGLVTTHCAISEIAPKITKTNILQKISVIHQSLKADFKIVDPQIAVTSLNPHKGEGGLFGKEELQQISPAIEEANRKGIKAKGPFPADTLFVNIKENNYDAYLAMYHDQGLIPFKMKSFGKGVNFTAGLPIIRTSPDHGTAFDIAGTWLANESSMKEAIKVGYQLAEKRKTS